MGAHFCADIVLVGAVKVTARFWTDQPTPANQISIGFCETLTMKTRLRKRAYEPAWALRVETLPNGGREGTMRG